MEDVDWQELSKSERLEVRLRMHSLGRKAFPASYTSNDTKEEIVLEYAARFESQYGQLFPNRPKLSLSCLNEANVPKFLSTCLKPTNLRFPSLFEYSSCAAFFKSYITYEPLEDPTCPPSHLVSPTTTLQFQKGDSFDLSVLLCSVLLGAGFDAYVAVGYVSETVAFCVNSRRTYTETEPSSEHYFRLLEEDSAKNEEPPPPSKYVLKSRPVLEVGYEWNERTDDEIVSELLLTQPKQTRREILGLDEEEGEDDAEQEAMLDEYALELELQEEAERRSQQQRFVHAWVVVLAGKRGVTTPFFLESSTGQELPPTHSDYYSIEYLYNSSNLWVNMQRQTEIPNRRSKNTPIPIPNPNPLTTTTDDEISFDLQNKLLWENVFVTNSNETLGVVEGDLGRDVLDLPLSWVGRLRLSRAQFESRFPRKVREVRYRDVRLDQFARYSREDLMVMRVVVYEDPNKKSENENEESENEEEEEEGEGEELNRDRVFVPREIHRFYERRGDGLKRHSVYYQMVEHDIDNDDDDDDQEEEEEEYYSSDDDSDDIFEDNPIRKRKRKKMTTTTTIDPNGVVQAPEIIREVQSFDRRSTDALREITIEPDRTSYRFYPEMRLDGLSGRIEVTRPIEDIFSHSSVKLKQKITSTYANRDDRLVFRSVTFDSTEQSAFPDRNNHRSPPNANPNSSSSSSSSSYHHQSSLFGVPVISVTEEEEENTEAHLSRQSRLAALLHGQGPLPPILKKAEKFERHSESESVPAHRDIQKILYLKTRHIVHYHYGDGKITRMKKVFELPGTGAGGSGGGVGGGSGIDSAAYMRLMYSSDDETLAALASSSGDHHHHHHHGRRQGTSNAMYVYGPDPHDLHGKLEDSLVERDSLRVREKMCLEDIRTERMELAKILSRREEEEANVTSVTTIYDTLRNRPTPEEAEEMELERHREEERKKALKDRDVLASYIPKSGIRDRAHAEEIYRAVLEKLRDRILLRAEILSKRLKTERATMHERNVDFQKRQSEVMASDDGSGSSRPTEDEFLRVFEDSLFRLNILIRRARQNRVESSREYKAMQRKLITDERLSKFLHPDAVVRQ